MQPNTQRCPQCEAEMTMTPLGPIEGEEHGVHMKIDGMPAMQCPNGHKCFVAPTFPAEAARPAARRAAARTARRRCGEGAAAPALLLHRLRRSARLARQWPRRGHALGRSRRAGPIRCGGRPALLPLPVVRARVRGAARHDGQRLDEGLGSCLPVGAHHRAELRPSRCKGARATSASRCSSSRWMSSSRRAGRALGALDRGASAGLVGELDGQLL